MLITRMTNEGASEISLVTQARHKDPRLWDSIDRKDPERQTLERESEAWTPGIGVGWGMTIKGT
jgi:hypothetical protein